MVEPNATTMIYQLALSQVPHIGPVLARNLVAYCGSAEAVFSESFSNLKRIPGIGDKLALEICGFKNFDRLFREVEFINANNIQVDFFTDASYPFRLRQIPGAPVALFRKGGFDLDHNRVLAIIGTRKSSKSSRDAVLGLVKELKSSAPLIVSGLAYGIDSVAHRAAVENGLSTVGVLGHGLDRIYPARNTGLANSMMLNGGLLTEFMSNTKPDRENFPKRNRIVAGLVDAVLVVESPLKGGSVITANLAFDYDREVMAFPGRVNDVQFAGCNRLIKHHKAHLVESAQDIAALLNWDVKVKNTSAQMELPLDLSSEEQRIFDALRNEGGTTIDSLSAILGIPSPILVGILLEMELKNVVRSLPGKLYELV